MIFHLEHEDNILEKEEEILKHVIDYYKNCLTPQRAQPSTWIRIVGSTMKKFQMKRMSTYLANS
jgi:hypothetical protein